MNHKIPSTIIVETSINESLEKTWEYWTEPHHIIKWYFASDDWHTPYAENDLRINGKFKTTMAAKDGSMSFDFEGVYKNILDFKLIEYNIIDNRKVSIHFTKEGHQTKITEEFEPESLNSFEVQKSGWQSILNNFKKYTEQ